MDWFDTAFVSSSLLIHGVALGKNIGIRHEVVTNSAQSVPRLDVYWGQSLAKDDDGDIHDRLQGIALSSANMALAMAGTLDLIPWSDIQSHHDHLTNLSPMLTIDPTMWYKDFTQMSDVGVLVDRFLKSMHIDKVSEYSFESAWKRILKFERQGRSYNAGSTLHVDHYNSVQRLAAMLLREVGTNIMRQFSTAVDWGIEPRAVPLSSRSLFWNEIEFLESSENDLKKSRLSHPALSQALTQTSGTTGAASESLVSSAFSAVFASHAASQYQAPWGAPPAGFHPGAQLWSQQAANQTIMHPGAPPAIPGPALPQPAPNPSICSGPSTTPTGLDTSHNGTLAHQVVRCDKHGNTSASSGNSHIQVADGDIVSLEALAAVYGGGLCPGALASPLLTKHALKHCDCAGQAGHERKNSKAHKLPGFHGPQSSSSWNRVKSYKKSTKKSSSTKSKKKK